MRSAQVAATPAGIGAWEIKSSYQRNMFLGVILASGTALILMGGMLLYAALQPEPEAPPDIIIRSFEYKLKPIPTMVSRPKIKTASGPAEKPVVGIPVPVDDDFIVEEIIFATTSELADYVNSLGAELGEGGEDENVVYAPSPEVFPDPDIFIFVEETPVVVYEEPPVYPDMAERAGIVGTVWVKVLVDLEGRVCKAIIAKASGTNAGFEEAAIEAAMKNRYRPAIQNGRPVAVWLSYKVVFDLE
jgi:protein TonB